MTVTVRIPTPLRSYAGGASELALSAANVGDALDQLVEHFPDLRRHLFADDGELRNFVNAYVNDEDMRHLDGRATPLTAGDAITIVPSIAGGAPGGGGHAPHPRGAAGVGAATAQDPATAQGPANPQGPATAHRAATAHGVATAQAGVTGVAPMGGSAAVDVDLSAAEIRRYSRHLIMPEVGMDGQRKLKQARVLMVGAGGLGSPLGLYLAAAGVGTIGIVDFDVVDETNLQRQVLHGTKDVGRPKLASARERIGDVNPNVRVEGHEVRLTSENALDILADYDVVVDGTDNFPTRYLVNDACVLLGKPNVYGSIFRFEGQVSVFWAERGPCYRCLFREPPPPGLVPSCAEGGVLGVLPGIVGSLQALETIKLLIGRGDALVGRLVLFDALAMRFRELKLRKNPACPACGDAPTITGLIDYDEFCGIPQAAAAEAAEQGSIPEIGAADLQRRLQRGDRLTIVDVREPHEWDIVNLEQIGARLIPLGQVPARMHELDTADEIVLHCRSGARSARALAQLRDAGFRRLWNLKGGILAWSEEVDPSMPRY